MTQKQVEIPEKEFNFTFKISGIRDEKTRIIEGYANIFDIMDRQDDIVTMKTFQETINEFMKNPVMRYMHEPGSIGKFLSLEIREKGLFVVGQLSAPGIDPKADMVWKKILAGELKSFSIGAKIQKQAIVQMTDGRYATELLKLDLKEISIVDVPASQGSFFNIVSKLVEGITKEKVQGENLEQINARKLEKILKEAKKMTDKPDKLDEILSSLGGISEKIDATNKVAETNAETIKLMQDKLAELDKKKQDPEPPANPDDGDGDEPDPDGDDAEKKCGKPTKKKVDDSKVGEIDMKKVDDLVQKHLKTLKEESRKQRAAKFVKAKQSIDEYVTKVTESVKLKPNVRNQPMSEAEFENIIATGLERLGVHFDPLTEM